MFDMVLNMLQILNVSVLNIPGLICWGSEYASGSEYVRVFDIPVLNMSG